MREAGDGSDRSVSNQRTGTCHFGPFTFDARTLELRRSGRGAHLPPKPAAVLLVLLQRSGCIVLRDELGAAVWPDGEVDLDHALNACILQIRRALGDSALAPSFIETVPRRGYRFRAEVDWIPDAAVEGDSGSMPDANGRPTARRNALRLAVAAGVLALVCGSWVLGAWGVRSPRAPSLLIVPFDDFSAHGDSTFFAEGLTDDLIATISTASPEDLKVVGFLSSTVLAERLSATGSVPPELGIDYVVRGSVRRQGTRIRVVASLTRIRDNLTLWARTYDRVETERLSLQSEIATDVAGSLEVSLGQTPSHLQAIRFPTAEAQEAYAIGRHLLRQATWQAGVESIERFAYVAEAAPHSAPAHAYLAEALLWFGTRDTARAVAARALALDGEDAHAVYVTSQVRLLDEGASEETERLARKAVALSPGRSEYRAALAFVLSTRGRHRASIREMDRAFEIDPVSPAISGDAGLIHYWARRFDGADARCRATLDLGPHPEVAMRAEDCIANAALQRGDTATAVAATIRWLERAGHPPDEVWSATATNAEKIARFQDWRSTRLLAFRKQGFSVAFERARFQADLGRLEAALDELELAAQERTILYPSLGVEPRFDPLRRHPRFLALLEGKPTV